MKHLKSFVLFVVIALGFGVAVGDFVYSADAVLSKAVFYVS